MTEPPQQQPSPSPPPEAPIQQTPGPRAAAFITLYNNALANTLKSVSYDSFAACFPEIARRAPEALKALHGGMVQRLRGFAKDEFEVILKERNVIENLNRLEDLILDARKRKSRAGDGDADIIPPHTLPPLPLLSSHLTPIYKSQQSQLNAKLQTTQSQNATLFAEIQEQRKEIEELLRIGEGLVGDLEKAGGKLAGVKGMGEEAREGEGGLERVDS